MVTDAVKAVCFVIGFALLMNGSLLVSKELHNRDDVSLVGCEFVSSTVSGARCPRKQYDGCGCPNLVNVQCDEIGANSNDNYCCAGSCTTRSYYRGRWHTHYDAKQYLVTYVDCNEVSAVFRVSGKEYVYSYFCDDGRLFDKAVESARTHVECESMYETRESCYLDGRTILMDNPYRGSSLIGGGVLIALGSVFILACFLCVVTDDRWNCWCKIHRWKRRSVVQPAVELSTVAEH